MLNKKEIEALRENAKVHTQVFEEIKKMVKPWISAIEVDELAWKICKNTWTLPWFKGVYGFPANICISINDAVVHGVPRKDMIFKDGDVVKFDFWVKDKKYWVNTDSAFTMIIWNGPHNPEVVRFLQTNKEALYKWIEQAYEWNKTWDIGYAIQKHVEDAGFYIVRELTWHGVGKTLHEKPYIYNYWKKGTWEKLKVWMTLAIEPITWFSSGKIYDKGGWEIYIKDGSVWAQFEHTILITENGPEIIV